MSNMTTDPHHPKAKKPPNGAVAADPNVIRMSFGDHLDELRKRLLLAIMAPIPLFIIVFIFSDDIIDWFLLPLYAALEEADLPKAVQVLTPPEFLLTQMKVGFIGALILSCPWLFWQAWLFIRPGLFPHERRFVYLLLPGSCILSIGGIALMYFAMLPLMLRVLILFGAALNPSPVLVNEAVESVTTSDLTKLAVVEQMPEAVTVGDAWVKMPERLLQIALPQTGSDGSTNELLIVSVPLPQGSTAIEQQFRLADYISFVLVLMLGICIAFQMPLVVMLLGWLNIASASWFKKRRKYALLVCAITSAILTPADAISMFLMLIPLYGLYEFGIVLLQILPAHRVISGKFFGSVANTTSDDEDETGDK
ncbi:MAG: twin-arginine translocase subunit TatC [Phycisphaerales bacterium]|nr:twin-arginine translocase subunit TatC [Phycisphaerales bacterium]